MEMFFGILLVSIGGLVMGGLGWQFNLHEFLKGCEYENGIGDCRFVAQIWQQ